MIIRVKEEIRTTMTKSSCFIQTPMFTLKEKGSVDSVLGATIVWGQGKGILINVEHTDPSRQALMDFRDGNFKKRKPLSNFETGAETTIAIQMGLDAMYPNEIIQWLPELGWLVSTSYRKLNN